MCDHATTHVYKAFKLRSISIIYLQTGPARNEGQTTATTLLKTGILIVQVTGRQTQEGRFSILDQIFSCRCIHIHSNREIHRASEFHLQQLLSKNWCPIIQHSVFICIAYTHMHPHAHATTYTHTPYMHPHVHNAT